MAYHALHRDAESNAAIDRAESISADRFPYQVACAHAFRGDTNAAFRWLDLAHARKDIFLEYIKGDWVLRGLRPDPRFKALLHSMNLPE